jgi:hypothetical protein
MPAIPSNEKHASCLGKRDTRDFKISGKSLDLSGKKRLIMMGNNTARGWLWAGKSTRAF